MVTGVLDRLREIGIRPNRRFGQCFLVDGNMLDLIAREAELPATANVLEIGPGPGNLTERLLPHCARLVAVERDGRFRPLLGDLAARFPKLEVLVSDVLDPKRTRIVEEVGTALAGGEDWILVSNLPYSIASTLILLVLESDLPIRRLVVTVQREVADRLCAEPGTKAYGQLTVLARFFSRIERVREIPASVFRPRPKVSSTLLRIERTDPPFPREVYPEVKRTVRAAFFHRRKVLPKSLAACPAWGLGMAQTRACLARAGIDPARRGESLSGEEFLALREGRAEAV